MEFLIAEGHPQSAVKMPISEQERMQRKAAIDFARGSSRFEGIILDPAAEALFARYIDGELTRPMLNEAVLKLAATR